MTKLSTMPTMTTATDDIRLYAYDPSETNPINRSKSVTVGAIRSIYNYPVIAGELGVTSTVYPIGDPRRYGGIEGAANNTVALQAALTAGVLVGLSTIPNGTWKHTGLTVPSNLLVQLSEGAVLTSSVDNAIGLHINAATNVRIEGGTITSTAAIRGDGIRITDSTDCTIEDVEASGCDMGFRLTGTGLTARIHVRGCKSSNSIESGFLTFKAFDCEFFNCVALNSGTTSLHHGFYISDVSSRSCKVVLCLSRAAGGSGIQFGGQDHTITHNTCELNGTNGIVNSLGSESILSHNICKNNTNRGMFLDTCDGLTVLGNRLHDNGLYGLELKNSRYCILSKNKATNNVRHGIYLNGTVAGESVRENSLVGNICIDNDSANATLWDGIYLDGNGGTCARNTLQSNVCRSSDGVTKQRYGINLNTGTTNTMLFGNQTFGNKVDNYLDNGTDTTFIRPQNETYTFHSANFNVTSLHHWMRCDAGGASFTATLPDAANFDGRVFTFSRIDASSQFKVTIATTGGQLINGATTWVITGRYQAVQLLSVGTAWYAIAIGQNFERVVTVNFAMTPYTVQATDTVVLVDASAGATQVSMPFVAGSAGRQVTIKKIDASANNVTIAPQGAELIDGAVNQVFNTQWMSKQCETDGAAWYILNR